MIIIIIVFIYTYVHIYINIHNYYYLFTCLYTVHILYIHIFIIIFTSALWMFCKHPSLWSSSITPPPLRLPPAPPAIFLPLPSCLPPVPPALSSLWSKQSTGRLSWGGADVWLPPEPVSRSQCVPWDQIQVADDWMDFAFQAQYTEWQLSWYYPFSVGPHPEPWQA